jgi:hypothetical protein
VVSGESSFTRSWACSSVLPMICVFGGMSLRIVVGSLIWGLPWLKAPNTGHSEQVCPSLVSSLNFFSSW